MKRLLLSSLLLLPQIPARTQSNPTATATVTASNLQSGGVPITGQVCLEPRLTNGKVTDSNAGGNALTGHKPYCAYSTNGAVSIPNVPMTDVTLPKNICYAVMAKVNGSLVLGGPGSGLECWQPTVAAHSLDSLQPNLPTQATVQYGPQGPAGPGATITIGTVTAGSTPAVVNVGTATNAVLNFTLPAGGSDGGNGGNPVPPTLSIGTTTTGAPGSQAAVTVTGSNGVYQLNFTIPAGVAGAAGSTGATGAAGANGAAASVNVGTVTTGAAGSSATVTNAGTTSAAVLDFIIPKGDKGDQGTQGIQGVQGTAGATGSSGAAGTNGEQGAIVYSRNSWTDTSDFTVIGAATLTVSNGKLVTTAVNNGTFVNGFYLKNTSSNDDDLDIEVVFTTNQTSGPYGIGVGKIPSSTINPWGMAAFWNGNISSYLLQTYYVQPGSSQQLGSNVSGTSISSGNTYRMVYSQRGTRFVSLVYDFTGGVVANSTNYVPMTSCAPKFPNTDYAGIYNNGGTYTIQSIRVISRKPQQPELALAGDSKVLGCAAGARDMRFASGLGSLGPVAVYAGSRETTQGILNDLPYILATKPKRLLLHIGRNDLANGVSAATWQANCASIVNQSKAAGVVVTHLLPIPETVQADQSALKTFIQTTFSGDQMIDPSVGFNTSTMLANGIHPNGIGNAFINSLILSSGFFPSSSFRQSSSVSTEAVYPTSIF